MKYFAYGSNMLRSQMLERCPEAKFGAIGTFLQHKLIINQRGVATVLPVHDGVVWGVLWLVSERDIVSLDGFEGVGLGLYQRRAGEIFLQTGTATNAEIYIASDSEAGSPRPGYVQKLIEGAEEHALPDTYVTELRKMT